MPELPEVETITRGLRRSLPGRRIVDVRFGKTDFVDDPRAIEVNAPGRRIEDVLRFGKFILLRMGPRTGGGAVAERSPDASYLVVHLGMTGQLTPRDAKEPAGKHTHAQIRLDDGRELRYTDMRRFGRMAWVGAENLKQILGELGEDPLEVSEEEFRKRLGGRRAMVKALLLDQHVLRGMGNIYADESLWRARIHPQRDASAIRRDGIRRLHRAIQQVLRDAIRLGGSSVSDYVNAEGERGMFQRRHRVYQREGKGCYRCGAAIRRVIVAGRSSYFCPRCQKAKSRKTKNGKRKLRRRSGRGED